MAQDLKPKKHSKGFFVRLFSGTSLAVIAIATTLSVMIPSYVQWKNYYNEVMAEKAEKERLNALPLEFLGISAELYENVKYYDNDTAQPEKSDFIVKANFTEKGKDFSKKLNTNDFSMTVPEDFSKKGGTIKFSYIYTPEKKDGEVEDPKPIEKTTELKITLIEPDETIFKIVKEPTFTETGYAENIKGTKKELEALNMVDYDYEEKTSTGVAIFTHKSSGIIIKKAITSKLIINGVDGKRNNYNNVNCHFANDIEGLKISFIDDAFVLTPKNEQRVAISSIEGKEASVDFGSGEFLLKGTINVNKLTLRSNVKVNINGYILSNNMLAEKDSELNLTTSGSNGIIIGENGFASLYGKMTFTGSNNNTAIELKAGATLSINSDSRLVITNCWLFLGTFIANKDGFKMGYLCVPEDMVSKDGNYYVGEACIVDRSLCNEKWLCNIEVRRVSDKYILVTKPDTTHSGFAKDFEGNDIVLPVLNFTDYDVEVSKTSLIFNFLYNEIKIGIELSFEKVDELKVDGLTINYYDETGYKFIIDENKEIEISGNLIMSSLTISGKGSLSITGSVSILKSLLVESESTLKVTGTTGDAVNVNGEGKLQLFGNVIVNSAAGKTGVNIHNPSCAIYITDTSRVTVSGGAYTIAHFDTGNKVKVYYPKTASLANKKITASDGNVLLSYGATNKIEFVAEE